MLAVAQFELVDRLGWLTREEYVETLSVGQVLPGPNIVNLSLMVGDRYFGLRGAFSALAGMLVLPMIIKAGFDVVWFGIFIVQLIALSLWVGRQQMDGAR